MKSISSEKNFSLKYSQTSLTFTLKVNNQKYTCDYTLSETVRDAEAIKKGDVIGQAIFQKYFVSDDDSAEGQREGGFGSTSK